MNATEIQKILDAKVYNEVDEEPDVDFGYSCDLMSDVLACPGKRCIAHRNCESAGDSHLSNGGHPCDRICSW